MNTNEKKEQEILEKLSPEERELTLKILNEYVNNGSSSTHKSLLYDDYEEIPVDIDTFIDNPNYLGQGTLNNDGSSTIFPYWRKVFRKVFPNNVSTTYNTLILTGGIGLGKAQPMDALVLTENGFKQNKDLKIGEKVYGVDGKLYKIDGIFYQGKRKHYKVIFKDGTSTLCADNHLWTIYNKKHKYKEEVISTEDLAKCQLHKINSLGFDERLYSIPLCKPIRFKKHNHFIDPYLLGCLIGDGGLTTASVCFTNNDLDLLNNIQDILNKKGYKLSKIKQKYGYHIVNNQKPCNINEYKREIKRLNLNCKSENKFIPKEYLIDSVENRIALLQGLMDTDGYISKESVLQYNTSSEQLAKDFVFIVQSLGGVVSSNKWKKTAYKKNNQRVNCKGTWTITFKLSKDILPCRLKRKLDRLNPKRINPRKLIEKVEYYGELECQCIHIDSKEHLYITNDFIITHNTTVAVVGILYMLYRMLCLKDPYEYYGLQPIDKITFAFMNITLNNAKGVAWSKCQELLQASPWFMTHGKLNRSSENPEWVAPKGIELIYGSTPNHILGRCLFACFEDEISFQMNKDIDKQKEKARELVSSVDARMKSRFMKGERLPTLNILASSKRTEQSFLESFIETKKRNESKTTLIIDEPQWVVRNDKDSPNKFCVAVGNKFLASEVLPLGISQQDLESFRARGYSILEVPMGYYENFIDDLDIALTDIAGISTSNSIKYISGVRWNECVDTTLENPMTQEVIEVGNAPNDYSQYYDFFDLSKVPNEIKSRPMYIHLDMSLTGDRTGIAGVSIVGKRPLKENETSEKTLFYQLVFSFAVKAPKGYQISFEKNKQFIYWLKKQGFNIKSITADSYQSASVLQDLQAQGFHTEVLSVDRVDTNSHLCIPYQYFKSTIYERNIKIYKTSLLTEEIVNLERDNNGKIEHSNGGRTGCFIGSAKVRLVDSRSLTMKELVEEFEQGKENYVYTFNEKEKKIEPKKIKKAWLTIYNANLIEITLDNGESVKCTPNHLFMLRDGSYIQGQYLQEGNSLKTLCEEKIVNVLSVKFLDEKEDVYDLSIEDNHNFALDIGVFVHNSKDIADSVCGAVYDGSRHAEEYSYDYGENLETLFESNKTSDENNRQLIVDLEEELKQLSTNALQLNREEKDKKENKKPKSTNNNDFGNYHNNYDDFGIL